MTELTDAKRRIVERLKLTDTATASELAADFGLTDTAVRQHLESLGAAGLVVRHVGQAQGRGRPASTWRLTPRAGALFPDRHADLAAELLESMSDALGDDAVAEVIDARARRQLAGYQRAIGSGSVVVRVRRLAEQRTAEGYLAEVRPDGDDLLLIEHHCPICSAASACRGLCDSELEVFRDALGADVSVTREQHLLRGDQRCTYRISGGSGRRVSAA